MYYGGRLFRPVKTSDTSQTGTDTIFKYEQDGDLVTATYSGGHIKFGHIIGVIDAEGLLDMRYQHVDRDGKLMTGYCKTTPEVLPTGKIRLHEKWRWTCGHRAKGRSTLEEI